MPSSRASSNLVIEPRSPALRGILYCLSQQGAQNQLYFNLKVEKKNAKNSAYGLGGWLEGTKLTEM